MLIAAITVRPMDHDTMTNIDPHLPRLILIKEPTKENISILFKGVFGPFRVHQSNILTGVIDGNLRDELMDHLPLTSYIFRLTSPIVP